MTAPTIYRSSDSSAPTLDGTAGSLVTVLDACLVNGYTGKAAAGWSIVFTTTNKRVYRMGSPSAGVPPRQMDLDVDDTGPNVTDTTKSARVRGYDQASGIGAGSNAFPPAGTNICIRKKSAATSGAVTWILIADESSFYLWVQTGDTASTYYGFYFGEFYSYAAADQYKTIICGRGEAATGIDTGSVNGFSQHGGTNSGVPQVISGQWSARDSAGLNVGSAGGKYPFLGYTTSFPYTGGVVLPYPNGADGALLMSPIGVLSGATLNLHGEMRGQFYAPHLSTNFTDGDTFTGSGALAGRTFLIIKLTDKLNPSSGAGTGYTIIETTAWPRST